MLTPSVCKWVVRVAVLQVLGCVWLAAEPASASLPTYWRYAHPDAKVLMGVDVRGIMNSPVGQKFFQEIKSIGGKWTGSANADEMALLTGIDRIFISAPSQGFSMQPTQQKEVVIAIQGAFDLAKLRRMVSSKGQKKLYKGIEMWVDGSAQPGKPDMTLALVSPQLLVLGDPESLKAAIDNHASAGPEKAYDPVFLRATELAPLYEFWFVGNIPPKALAGGEGAPSPFGGFEAVESFEAGISLKQGMQLQFNLNAESPADASKIAQGLAGMMMFATASQSSTPELGEFLKRVKFGSAGAQVQVSAAWTQPELEAGLKTMRARVTAGAGNVMANVPVRPAASGATEWNVAPQQSQAQATIANAEPQTPVEPPPPAGPLTVKILNADGGSKELVISPKP